MSYSPKQGDIIKLDFSPTKGHEQRGRRPALVVSNDTYNKYGRGIVIVCPITNTDRGITTQIKLDNRTTTTGVIMTDQIKALDLSQRNPDYIEDIPFDILVEICDIIGGFTEIEDLEQDEEATPEA
jgi:mRNA interferase MazF